MAIELISSCVDSTMLDKYGLEYICTNRDVAVIISTVVDQVRDQVSRYMDINFDAIRDEICPMYDSNGSPEGSTLEENTNDESRGWRLSTLLSSETTQMVITDCVSN